MLLSEVVAKLELDVRTDRGSLDRDVAGGYASDLMSDVLANANEGDLWVTLQTHQNTVAVASMKGLAGIILVNGRGPEEETLARAQEEGIPLMVSSLSAFELIGRLYGMGLSGTVT